MSPQAAYILQDQIVPRLRSAIPVNVNAIGSEDAAEIIQDATAMSAKLLDNAERRKKKVTPGNIAYFTILHMRSGRRSYGSSCVDIMGTGTQINGSAKLHSLHEVVSQSECGDEIFELQDVISQDQDDPSIQAARNIDWHTFCAGLTKIERILVNSITAGLSIREMCRKVKMTKTKLGLALKALAAKVVDYMGADILTYIMHSPVWRIGLDCEREMTACRVLRRCC